MALRLEPHLIASQLHDADCLLCKNFMFDINLTATWWATGIERVMIGNSNSTGCCLLSTAGSLQVISSLCKGPQASAQMVVNAEANSGDAVPTAKEGQRNQSTAPIAN